MKQIGQVITNVLRVQESNISRYIRLQTRSIKGYCPNITEKCVYTTFKITGEDCKF